MCHDKAIVAENCLVGDNTTFGIGSDIPNKLKPAIYSFGLVAVGEKSVIPDGVQIGKNTAISGVTSKEDYPNGVLESGETLIKAGLTLHSVICQTLIFRRWQF